MSASLHIHVFEEGQLTEKDFKDFFYNCFGSKWFDINHKPQNWRDKYRRMGECPNIFIGEVSWLKAMVLDDNETFVPGIIQQINDLVGEDIPLIDDEFINKVKEAFNSGNSTQYNIADVNDVVEFLEMHQGKRTFTVSW